MHGARRILLVYPRFTDNLFLNYQYMAPFYPHKTAVMPPLGLLTFAGTVPSHWDARLVDENVRPLSADDLAWADVVAISGMHPQRVRINEILELAAAHDKLTVVGGPSVSICPEFYPQASALHVGEIGDGTQRLWAYLERTCTRPATQQIFRSEHLTPLDEQPLPALTLIDVRAYLLLAVQFSVGCPYTCEFCDIPVIYGRKARLKSATRVLAELQAIYETGFLGAVLWVDDNLIANRAAFRRLLPDVIDWQARHEYPFPFTGEASVNIAEDRELLRLMQQARFSHLFLGVESPDPVALESISKRQNTREPLLDSIRTIQRFGIEVVMGMIFGFDTDTPRTGEAVQTFVRDSKAPIVYFNLLSALPKTALWNRLAKEHRLLADDRGDALGSENLLSCLSTNVDYKLPNDVVRRMLLDTIEKVYAPSAVYERVRWNAEHVFGQHRPGVPPSRTWAQRAYLVRYMLATMRSVLWGIGVKSGYREEFWRFVALLVRLRLRGRIASILEILLRVTPNAHHTIVWGARLLQGVARADLPVDAPRVVVEPTSALVSLRRPGARTYRRGGPTP